MKILNSKTKNFDKNLDSLLLQRKKKVQSNSVSVSNIIKEWFRKPVTKKSFFGKWR